MTKVAPDMMKIESERVFCRPIRSPKWPQTMPPIGRTMKESAKTA